MEEATLVQTSGLVSLRKDNGEKAEPLKGDAKVAAGTLVVEGEGSCGKFAFADGSTFELFGGSELTLAWIPTAPIDTNVFGTKGTKSRAFA
jgi:hypothetical protein